MPITTQLSAAVTTLAGSTSPNAYASTSSPLLMAPVSPASVNLASTSLVDKNDEYNVAPSMPSLHEESEGKSSAGGSVDESPSFDLALLTGLPGVEDFLRTLSGAQSTSTEVFDAEQHVDLPSRIITTPKRRKLHGATSKRVVDDETNMIKEQYFAAFLSNDKTKNLRKECDDDAGELRYSADALQKMMLADPQAFIDALRQLEAVQKTDTYATKTGIGVENIDQAVALINALHMNAANGVNNVPSTATTSASNISPQAAMSNGKVSELLNFYASLMELARLSSCADQDLTSTHNDNCRIEPQIVAVDESQEHILPTTTVNKGILDGSQLAEMMATLASAGVHNNTMLADELGALLAATSSTSTGYNKNDDDGNDTALPVDERKSLLQAMITGLKSSANNRDDSYLQHEIATNVNIHAYASSLKNVNCHNYQHGHCNLSPSSASSSALSSPTAGSAPSSLCAIAKESIPARQTTASCQSVDSGIGAITAPLFTSYCSSTSRSEMSLIMSSLLEALANVNTAPAALALLAADKQMQTAFAEYLGAQTGGTTSASNESAVLPIAPPSLPQQLDSGSNKITEDMMRVALTQALKSSEQMHLDLNDIVKLQELNHAGRNDKVTVYGGTPTWFAPTVHSTPRRAHNADKSSTLYSCGGQDENYGVLTLNRNSNSHHANGVLKNGSPTLASVLDERKRKRPRTTSKTTSNVGAPMSTATSFAGSPVLKNVLAAAASSIKNVSSALSNAKLSNAADVNGCDDRANNNNNSDHGSVAAAATAAALTGNAIGCTGAEFLELSELEEFANFFKKQRIKHGFTQGDVGIALGKRYGTDFSQTTISRFEALNLSYKNMCKLRPLLKEWLEEAELMIENGATVVDILEAPTPNFAALATPGGGSGGAHSCSSSEANSNEWTAEGDTQRPGGGSAGCGANGALLNSLTTPRLIGSSIIPPLKRRRKRTNLDNAQKAALDVHFGANPRPNHQRMNEIAALLELDPDVVRVWFCNRRQKLRKVC